jgi:hypothetical protein
MALEDSAFGIEYIEKFRLELEYYCNKAADSVSLNL